jgi:hypothetical protein
VSKYSGLGILKLFIFEGLKVASITFTELDFERQSVLKILRAHEVLDSVADMDINEDTYKIMIWKGQNRVSDNTYRALCKVNLHENYLKKLPRLWRIKALEQKFATEYPVMLNKYGVYVNASRKIGQYLNNKFQRESANFPRNQIIRIKLSGDGTRVANTSLFNFTFSLMDFSNCNTASGNYSLGIFEMNENYDELKEALREIIENLKIYKEATINNLKYEIEWFLGGDMKFISTVLGLDVNFATGLFPCPWCKCLRARFREYKTMDFSITNNAKYARSLEEANRTEGHGYKNAPVIDFIPFDHVVIDLLHLWLRISGNILDELLKEIEVLDGGWNTKNVEANIHFSNFKNFLENECKIKNPFYVSGAKFVMSSFSGKIRERIFAKIDLMVLLPDLDQCRKKNEIFKTFFDTYCGIRDNILNEDQIKSSASKFMDLFVSFYGSNLTPYMHCFVSHLHEFRELYGDFNKYNQEGLEKLNDLTTMDYFRSTNRIWQKMPNAQNNFLVQILNKRNRTELCLIDV